VLQCAYTSTSHLTTEQTKGCAFRDGMKDDLPVPLYTMDYISQF